MYDDDELTAMTDRQRMDLARRLAELEGAPIERTPRIQRERRLFMSSDLLLRKLPMYGVDEANA